MDEILPLWELWLVASVLGVIMVMIVAAILVQHVGVPLVVAIYKLMNSLLRRTLRRG